MAEIFHSPPIRIPLESLENTPARIDLEFTGVDHSMASYRARIFANNPDANEETEPSVENGYLGSFTIFGHGGCLGDEGHCEVSKERRPYDRRPAHPLVPITKRVTVTRGIRRICESTEEVRFTIVPIVKEPTPESETETPLRFDTMSVLTYD